MPIVDCEEAATLADVLQNATSILAFLFLRSGAHQRRDVHFNVFHNEGRLLFVSLLVLFLLLLAFALAKETQEIHRNYIK